MIKSLFHNLAPKCDFVADTWPFRRVHFQKNGNHFNVCPLADNLANSHCNTKTIMAAIVNMDCWSPAFFSLVIKYRRKGSL